MKRIAFLFVAVAIVAGIVVSAAPTSGPANEEAAAPIYGITIPPGYRDWKLISVAHEEGNLNDLRAQFWATTWRLRPIEKGSFRSRTALSLPRLHWSHVPSEENNKVFGRPQSFVAGPPPVWYIQFMVKDSKKYAATGGWGFAQFVQMANLATRRCTKPASPATSLRKLATLSSPITHLNTGNELRAHIPILVNTEAARFKATVILDR